VILAPVYSIYFAGRQKLTLSLLIIPVCLFNFLSGIIAQGGPTQSLVFQNITINDGLSQGMINGILQDRYGFMWFATKDGLNQYDGYHFRIYRHDADDSTSIADSYVQTLFEDSKGRIWAGTNSGLVDVFNHATGNFQHILLDEKTNPNRRELTQITEDKHGNIWVLYYGSLLVISIDDSTETKPIRYTAKKIPKPINSSTLFLFVTNAGQMILANRYNSCHYLYDDAKNTWSNLNYAEDNSNPGTKTIRPQLFCMAEDTTEKKLYAICSNGIYLSQKSDSGRLLVKKKISHFSQALVDKDHNLWFTDGDSIGVYNPSDRSTRYVSPGSPAGIFVFQHASKLFFDRSGLLWIGTTGWGLLTLNYRAQRFHCTKEFSTYSILQTDDGRIWIDGGGSLEKALDIKTGKYTDTVPLTKGKAYFKNLQEFSYPVIRNHRNEIWHADDDRLICYHLDSKKATSYALPIKPTGNAFGLVSDIKQDNRDNIWIGTSEGLLRFDWQRREWKIFRNNPGDTTSLSFDGIFSICFDPANPGKYLWVGTNGGGLNRMDLTTGKCTRYSDKNGLPNNVVYGILPDKQNRIWMSTNKGLSCFDPAKQIFRNYEEKDGLQGNEFNHNAYLRAKDGTLFFGGVSGYNYFNPDDIDYNPVIPPVVLTDIRTHNKTIDTKAENSPLRTAPWLAKEITLPYSDNMITFDFAALDFTAPSRNLYQYKMEGFDKDWVLSGNIHSATYTNLDPGTYTFRVKGSNKDQAWNEHGTSIRLTILPPWYMTWWFRILVAIAAIATVYGFYRYRLQQALKLQAVRNRIASDLHDEIGSNLSNISIFSKVARQRKPETPQVADLLGKISEYTQTSMNAMNDIVWMINARNDRFENIMVRMRTLASELFEATNCNLHIEFDERLNNVKLDMDKRKNFYLIFKEGVNNIAKYAGCTDVWINMNLKNRHVVLIIKDNGKGFDPEHVKRGNGLVNMRTRAGILKGDLKLVSDAEHGTVIELIFPA
jgi:signal transduction histidine kinase/ligand-binding sensor domain-containing protein